MNWAESEKWTLQDDARILGARVVGRAGLFRAAQSDLERPKERVATGLELELADGTRVGVYWERTGDHSTSYFALAPISQDPSFAS